MRPLVLTLASFALCVGAPLTAGGEPMVAKHAEGYGKRIRKLKTLVATATVRGSGQAATMARACTNAQTKVRASCGLRRGKVVSVSHCKMVSTTRVGNQWEVRQRATAVCRLP